MSLAGRPCRAQIARLLEEECKMAKASKRGNRAKKAPVASLGSALDEIGFKTLGRRIKIRTGVDQPRLTRRPSTPEAGKSRD
jgi:hypothetical protein